MNTGVYKMSEKIQLDKGGVCLMLNERGRKNFIDDVVCTCSVCLSCFA